MLQTISPAEAKRLVAEGALLVDIREADEYAREHIPGAKNHALSRLSNLGTEADRAIIFHCRSGARTAGNAARLRDAAGDCSAFIVGGGIDAWKAAGLPVATDARRPIEIMRQVQIGAGSLVVLGVVLAATVHPAFIALSGAVGAGLVFAGASGTCMMANILRRMPWNRLAVAR